MRNQDEFLSFDVSTLGDTEPHAKKRIIADPIEVDCHYTALDASVSNILYEPLQAFDSYNFYSSRGVESSVNTVACCLTAYNEPLSEYVTSLSALADCAEFFREMGEERVSRELLICIVIDGIEKMSDEFCRWAQDIGIYRPELIDSRANIHLFESQIPRNALREQVLNTSFNQFSACAPLQRVILLIKSENKGKLNSHKCFFNLICGVYSTRYFVQIDVGTAPAKAAIYYMWLNLQENPDIAATAARSLLPYPENKLSVLQTWQFCDIAVERIVNWPSEIFLGNLSVLPGQLSLTRIQSLIGDSPDSQKESVLDSYYRGLSTQSPFESNMYLAEDRILGQEMVFQTENRWEISYETDAEATVDACHTWAELCQQRRRWICSSMACRFAVLGKIPRIFKNRERSFSEKIHKALAAAYFMTNSFFEINVVSIHWLIQLSLFTMSLSVVEHQAVGFGIKVGAILALGSFFVLLGLAVKRTISDLEGKIVELTNFYLSFCMVANLSVYTIYSQDILYVSLLFFSCLAYIGLSAFYCGRLTGKLAFTIFQYMAIRLPIKCFLMLFSVFNAHDTSWGTKGLNRGYGDEDSAGSYPKFRISVIGLFTISNLLFLYGCYEFLGFNGAGLALVYSILFVQMFISYLAILFSRNKSRGKYK